MELFRGLYIVKEYCTPATAQRRNELEECVYSIRSIVSSQRCKACWLVAWIEDYLACKDVEARDRRTFACCISLYSNSNTVQRSKPSRKGWQRNARRYAQCNEA
jgi:hypothetical protein